MLRGGVHHHYLLKDWPIFLYTIIRMLEIQKSRSCAAAKDYFDRSLRIGDYYREGQEVAGLWHGQAAARLRIAGPVTRQQFAALIDNQHPLSGEQLTPRMKANRVPGFDFTFTAPKSVSVLYALTGDERIAEAFRSSVIESMAEVEQEIKTRVRIGGKDSDRTTGNLLWGEFLHKTSRPIQGVPDPHLHIHAYTMNLTYDDQEKRWKAAQIGDIKGEGLYYEAVFHAALAKRLAEIGFAITRDGRSFEITGLDGEISDRFSRRRDVIEAAASLEGSETANAKKALSRLTREKKNEDLTFEALRDVWKSRILPAERRQLDEVVARAAHGLNEPQRSDVRQAAQIELAEALRSDSATPEKSVLTKILRRCFGDVRSPEAIAALGRQGLIRGEVAGRRWITTQEAARREAEIVNFARGGRNRYAPLGHGAYHIEAEWLNAQQRAAIQHVWSSQDQIMMVRGGAGVGKTSLMGEAIAGLVAARHKCFAFATTVPATEVLKQDGFASAVTIQKLLASEEMQKALGEDAVLWIDEAGLLDVESMARLFHLAADNHWRIVLCGDENQHTPVQRGDAMRMLRQRAHLPVAEVSEIVRQRGDYKRAVQAIEGGLVDDGWQKLERMGSIIEVDGPARAERLAADYLSCKERGDRVLVVAPTNRERLDITSTIRNVLRLEGHLRGPEISRKFLRDLYWGDEAKRDVSRYRVGQILRFRQHSKGGFKRGSEWTVSGVNENGVLITSGGGEVRQLPLSLSNRFDVFLPELREFSVGDRVRFVERCELADGNILTKGSFHEVTGITTNGQLIVEAGRTLPRDFAFLDHGYASTSVSSQGLTVDTVLVAMGAQSVPAMSKEQFYVSVSRGKRQVRLYVDDVSEVREAIRHSSERPSAHDLIEGKIEASTREARLKQWRTRLRRTAERMARDRGREIGMDAGLMRAARDAAMMQYQGRVADRAAELGD